MGVDEIEGDVRSVVPHADNNVHLSEPAIWSASSVVLHADNNVHLSEPLPAGDPVMAANKDSLLEFLRTTLYDNAPP